MGLSHEAAQTPMSASPESALRALQAFLEERRSARKPVEDFEEFEKTVHEKVLAVGQEIVAEELARLDLDVPAVEVGGRALRQVLRSADTYLSTLGPVRVERSLYRGAGDERALCPLELRAGIVEGRYTPRAANLACWVVAHLTPKQGEELFARIGGMRPSKSSLDRLPKQVSTRWEAERRRFEETLRSAEELPDEAVTVAVSLDGVMVPMKHGNRAEKRRRARAAGTATRGPAGHQEAGCGTVSFYDDETERLRTIRYGRMPESKKPTLKGQLLDELGHWLDERPYLRLVKLADGSRDNWTFLSEQIPGGVEIVDFYHACEHLRAVTIAVFGETDPSGRAQHEKLRGLLLEDPRGVEKVIRSVRYYRDKESRPSRREKLQAELQYFRRNRKRMRYAEYRAHGLPIGSGPVEAACKTLATQRLKRSGMRWEHEGGQAVLTLRALAQSERYDRAWAMLAATYKKRVSVPENVISLAERRPRRAVNS